MAEFWKEHPTIVAQVKQMLLDGLKAREIANRLTAQLGIFISRNAIIGLNHRKDLVPKQKQGKSSPRPRRKEAKPLSNQRITPKLKAADAPERDFIEPHVHSETANIGFGRRLKAIHELEDGDCRWPVGNPRHAEFGFCAAGRYSSSPYCEDHTDIAFGGGLDGWDANQKSKPNPGPATTAPSLTTSAECSPSAGATPT